MSDCYHSEPSTNHLIDPLMKACINEGFGRLSGHTGFYLVCMETDYWPVLLPRPSEGTAPCPRLGSAPTLPAPFTTPHRWARVVWLRVAPRSPWVRFESPKRRQTVTHFFVHHLAPDCRKLVGATTRRQGVAPPADMSNRQARGFLSSAWGANHVRQAETEPGPLTQLLARATRRGDGYQGYLERGWRGCLANTPP
jgi:hypothetical protein